VKKVNQQVKHIREKRFLSTFSLFLNKNAFLSFFNKKRWPTIPAITNNMQLKPVFFDV